MALNLYDATNGDGVFNVLGKVFSAMAAINNARGVDVPDAVDALGEAFQNTSPGTQQLDLVAALPSSLIGYQFAGDGLIGSLRQFAQSFLIDATNRNSPLLVLAIDNAISQLLVEMQGQSETVNASSVSAAATPAIGNAGTGVLVAGTKRGNGTLIELAVSETISVVASGPTVAVTSGPPAVDALSHRWPMGSGLVQSIPAGSSSQPSTLLRNGGFEAWTGSTPDGWIATVATPGTTLLKTTVEVQEVAISGTPTAGSYVLRWTDASSATFTTDPLAFNATASQVRAALRSIPGLGFVEVSSAGSSPNLTHTVTFLGQGGNVSQLAATSYLTGGSPAIGVSTTVAGTANVLKGTYSAAFASNGSELTTLYQLATGLEPSRVYVVNLWASRGASSASAGVIAVDLMDDIGGTVLGSVEFNASALSAAWKSLSELAGSANATLLVTPATMPSRPYWRIRIKTAITNGVTMYLDEVVVQPAISLYSGGPCVALFSGSRDFRQGDSFEIAVTNNRAGLVQEWFDRVFDMKRRGLQLPSDNAGGETIPDSVAV